MNVFDVNKQRILSFGNFGIPILKFKPETMALKGLDFYTIKKTYRNLAKKLWEELTLAIEEQSAIRKIGIVRIRLIITQSIDYIPLHRLNQTFRAPQRFHQPAFFLDLVFL